MRAIRYTLALVLLLAGCAQIGITQPQGFDQQLAYAYGTVTAVRQSAAAAVGAKTLSKADGQHVLALTDQTRAGLDAARLASAAGNTKDAQSALVLATGILTQLQRYLNERGSK